MEAGGAEWPGCRRGAFAASLSWQTLLAGIGATARRRLPAGFRVGATVAGNLIVLALAVVVVLR